MTLNHRTGFALLLSGLIAACGHGSAPGIGVPPTVTGPSITNQPQDQSVAVGSIATFSVTATGTGEVGSAFSFDGNTGYI